jgi:hypothetical protein
MSRATNRLLQRGGRNQYGITSEEMPKMNFEDRLKLENEFINTYKEKWLLLFSNMNKKKSWELLYSEPMNYVTPSLSSFYSEVRGYESMERYLLKFLLSKKEVALHKIGMSADDTLKIVREFNQQYYS